MSSGSRPISWRKSEAYSSGSVGGSSKVQHVGDQDRRDAAAVAQILLGERIDRHMLDGGQRRRKGSAEHVVDGVDRKPVSFPIEVVVMGDRGKPGLRNEVCQGDPQRDVHRDGQTVLGDQDIDIELACELVERAFEEVADGEDPARDLRAACANPEHAVIDPLDIRVSEVGVRHVHADIGAAVQLAAEPVADMPMVPEHFSPFGAFQRHAVGAGKARPDKTDTTPHFSSFPLAVAPPVDLRETAGQL